MEQNTTPLLCQVIVRGGSGVNPLEDMMRLLFVGQDDTVTFLMMVVQWFIMMVVVRVSVGEALSWAKTATLSRG